MKTVFVTLSHSKVMKFIDPATEMIAAISRGKPDFTEGMTPLMAMSYGLAMGMAMMDGEAAQEGKEIGFAPVVTESGSKH